MLKPNNATIKLFTTSEEDILEKLIKQDHAFRKLRALIDFDTLLQPYQDLNHRRLEVDGFVSIKTEVFLKAQCEKRLLLLFLQSDVQCIL